MGDTTSVPQSWPGKRYDLIFVFDYDEEKDAYVFSQTTQMVLPGDKDTTI
jgi:hypothetical protein